MKAAGIIAEYNPFHNGHAYQIQKAREISHADYIIAAMSGNFVQRGAPSIIDKFSRTYQALANGVDFVFEIPSLFAVSSAEYFASAGIALFRALGCVESVCFGCETPDLPLLNETARILSKEPPAYKAVLSSCLKQGLSFPASRQKALLSCITESKKERKDISGILSSPNNILAIEYIKAIHAQNAKIRPLPIRREGSGYHDSLLGRAYPSASAVRSLLLESSGRTEAEKTLLQHVPPQSAAHLLSPDAAFLTEEDFAGMLYYKLLAEKDGGFFEYADISRDFSNKIIRTLPKFSGYLDFCQALKSKENTYTHISRSLFHILLNMKKSDYENMGNGGSIPYLRLLGFRKKASPFFSEIKKHALLPLLSKPSRYASLLAEPARSIFLQDAAASDIYYGALALKSRTPQKNECQRSMVIL